VPGELSLLPHRLADWIRDAGLTQWFSVPSVLSYLAQLDAVRPGDFPALRRVLWCGDVLPTRVLRYWMRRLPHARFTNLYGPTETTIASSHYTVPGCPRDDAEAIPIGTACDGEALLVLDAQLRPVVPGAVGELHIRGVGLSPGYWKDAERTAAAFVYPGGRPDPASRMYRTGDLGRIGDGLVYFVGRADTQVKSRGHRIELGEVETALHALPALADGAVVALASDGFEGATICCAYVAGPGTDPGPATHRRALGARLPAYMLPSRWLRLDRLPMTANGKTDRVALRELFRREAAGA
jgi:acyl-coenzyme A synthetase/AMP-(fatty) acid ligase